jgi:glutaminyl-peptide cyclotransferase
MGRSRFVARAAPNSADAVSPCYDRRASLDARSGMLTRIALVAAVVLFTACGSNGDARAPLGESAAKLRVAVEQMYPHARDAFTEGLVYDEGWLYESTGLEGSSELRRVELESGRVERAVRLPDDVFGEGLALVGQRFVQLSWRSGRAFVYARGSLSLERELTYEGEGWGLCYDGRRLVMSDGSGVLQLRDPDTFERIGSVEVRDAGVPVDQLNELECVGNEVFANIWLTRNIARIDMSTGRVTGLIDADGLLSLDGVGDISGIDVLNGIAYVPERDRYLITGKYWPRVFEVKLVTPE